MKPLEISVLEAPAAEVATPLLVVPWFEEERAMPGAAELDARMGGAIGALLDRGDFRGRKDEHAVLYPREGETRAERVLLVGLGKREKFGTEPLRRALGNAVRQAQRLGVAELAVLMPEAAPGADAGRLGQTAAEAVSLAAWEFRELKSQPSENGPRVEIASLTLVAGGTARADLLRGARVGEIAARGENLARELAARPGNLATPTYLAGVTEELGQRHGFAVTVLDREAMRAEGMGALLAVAQGTEEEPRFIIIGSMRGGEGEPPLVLVGKGVTFDSGGISLKPAQNMEEMKYDMSGAAAVLGALQAIAELELRVNVVGLIPAAENLPSGKALKPGDVVRSHLGKTIEVVNTDAEGRLLLADALSYARRFRPAAVVDAATLTGACTVALGHHAIGLMGNDDALVAAVREAGERSGERCWVLPLWDEYRAQLDSDVADIKNTGGRPAGTITAGWFLKEFASEFPWAHLDIAGTAYRDDVPPYLRKGPTGVPTRLFVEWVRGRAEQA
ncbi:MAG TPA: leucyl aminopeptidase [Longimicrobiales bacterium]